MNRSDKRPLYDQLATTLIEKIEKDLNPHDKMISEREIAEKFNVSRTTVRLAITELETRGYIYKRHGKGTFVAAVLPTKQNLLEYYSFTEHMKAIGKIPRTKVIDFKVTVANSFIAAKMGLDIGEQVIKIKRLRLADEEPMMYESSYLPFHPFSNLTREQIEQKPLYELFAEEYAVIIRVADEEFSAGIVSDKDARYLEVPYGTPALKLSRSTYNHENKVVEFSLSIARGDQFSYKVRHTFN